MFPDFYRNQKTSAIAHRNNVIDRSYRPRPNHSGATIGAGLVAGLFQFCSELGVGRDTLANASDIDFAELANPDVRISLSSYIQAMRFAIKATERPELPLAFGQAASMSELSIVGLLMEASETVGDAYLQMRRYGRLAIEARGSSADPRFELVRKHDRLFLVDEQPFAHENPELTESAFAWLACGPRRYMKRSPVISASVTWPKPEHWHAYEKILGCPVHFESEWNALEMEPESLTWPVRQNPKYVFGVLADRADHLINELGSAERTSLELRNLLAAILHEGNVTAESAARRMGMSRQTLFRRLSAEGTDFTAVLRELREELAKTYLNGSKASLNEVAYLVGFSDASSFARAFKRWTGSAPGEFRQHALREAVSHGKTDRR